MPSGRSESRSVRRKTAERESAERANAVALAEAFTEVDGVRIVGREGYPAKLTARAMLVKYSTEYGQEFYIHPQFMARMDYYPDPFGDVYELGFELYCGNVALGRILDMSGPGRSLDVRTESVGITIRWGAQKCPEKAGVGRGWGVDTSEGGVTPYRAQEARL